MGSDSGTKWDYVTKANPFFFCHRTFINAKARISCSYYSFSNLQKGTTFNQIFEHSIILLTRGLFYGDETSADETVNSGSVPGRVKDSKNWYLLLPCLTFSIERDSVKPPSYVVEVGRWQLGWKTARTLSPVRASWLKNKLLQLLNSSIKLKIFGFNWQNLRKTLAKQCLQIILSNTILNLPHATSEKQEYPMKSRWRNLLRRFYISFFILRKQRNATWW